MADCSRERSSFSAREAMDRQVQEGLEDDSNKAKESERKRENDQ